MANKYHIFHIFASCCNLLFIRSIFSNKKDVLGYSHDSSVIATKPKTRGLINKYVISVFSYTSAFEFYTILKTTIVLSPFYFTVSVNWIVFPCPPDYP